MDIGAVTIIYLIASIFGTYLLYRFISIFFNNRKVSGKIELLSYMIYYLIMSAVYLKFNIPGINMAVNIALILCIIIINYTSTWQSKLIATMLIYVVFFAIEGITFEGMRLSGLNTYFTNVDMELIIALISSEIITYIVILALSNLKMIKNSVIIQSLHWLAIFIVPLGTLFLTILLIMFQTQENLIIMSTAITVLFIVNIFMFYLYDHLIRSYEEQLEKTFLQQQYDAYVKQFQLIQQIQEKTRIFKHDIKNNFFIIESLIKKGNNEEALNFLKTLSQATEDPEEFLKTGNWELDSILNYKISEAAKQNITFSTTILIPEKLLIDPYDLSVILGNLLDNAIEATGKTQGKEKNISIATELNVGMLYIHIANPFTEKLIYNGEQLSTTKKNKINHGLGLKSVNQSIEKYDGEIYIYQKDEIFHVDMSLFNKKKTKKV